MKDKDRERVKRSIKKFKKTGLLPKEFDEKTANIGRGPESSVYWGHVLKNAESDGERALEHPRSNPDQVLDAVTPWEPRYTEVQKDKLAAIQESFSVLTDQERRVIVLIYTENLTQEEIAGRLKISQARVSYVLKSARNKIQKIYMNNDSEEN